jgi:two-component sensor histidine kinase
LLSDLAIQIIHMGLRAFQAVERISVDVIPSTVLVTSDQAHNLALVIDELVSNTVKHALRQRDAARITACAVHDGDMIRFEFRDDGPGYPAEVLALERHGVGFDLIENIVRDALQGKLVLQNDRGAVAIVQFGAKARADQEGF